MSYMNPCKNATSMDMVFPKPTAPGDDCNFLTAT